MIVDTIKKVTSTTGSLPPVLLDLTQDSVTESNLEKDQTAHNREGYPITGQMAIEDAEAWAVGTKKGVPVTETDIQYQNNSKYYANVSGSILQMAGQQAIAAATSANNAHDSEIAAANSAIISGSYMRVAGEYKDEAENSAIAAGSSMLIAGNFVEDSEAWADGTRNGSPVSSTDPAYNNNAKFYKDECQSIAGSLTSVLKPKGTCLFANLPTIASSQAGDMWNIEDAFTTTSDFREGAGIDYAAGSNVYLTIDNKWDVLSGSNVVGVKGNAETNYRTGGVNITPADIGYFSGSTLHIGGTVPPSQGNKDKFFRGDGNWSEIPIFQGISGSIASVSGLVPPATDPDSVLKGNGTWGMGGNDALIAPVEKTSIATNAYSIGQQFVYGGVLCKAKTAIAIGDTFTLNTNYELASDITTQIKAIVDAYVTGIKGNAESNYRKGDVNLTYGNLGTADVGNGGTGKTSHTSNAVLTGNGSSALKNVATANGAFYATQANGAPSFGTLPVAQGGTGATSAADARTNLGAAASNHTHNYAGSSSAGGDATRALKLKDYTNNNDTYLDYGSSAITSASYIGAWDGYRLRAMAVLPFANGGTGANSRLVAAKNLTNENVGTSAGYFVTLTDSWGKFGYSSAANARSAMGLGNTTGVLPIANGGTGTNALTTAIQVVEYTVSVGSISSQAQVTKAVSGTLSGFYPMAVVNWRIQEGNGSSWVNLYNYWFSARANGSFTLQTQWTNKLSNTVGGSTAIKSSVYMLWVKV